MPPSSLSTPLRTLLGLAAFIVVIAGMRSAVDIIVPFLLAAFIAIVAAPGMFWLERRKVPAALAIFIVISVILIAVSAVAALIGTTINDFSRDVPTHQRNLTLQLGTLIGWLNQRGIEVSSQEILQYIDPGKAMQLVSVLLKGLGSVLSNVFLILLTVIFMLAEASSFPHKLRTIFGAQRSLASFETFIINVKTYVEIKTLTSFITGLLVTFWVWIIGLDYALLWGLLAFLLNYVPTIGSIIASVPAILLALIQLGPGSALLVTLGYVVVNVGIGNGVEPRFMGRGLGLSTLVVFLSLIFWGWVLGPIGMLLSVPLTMTAKIALDSRDDTRWLAILLGPERALVAPTEDSVEAHGKAPNES